MQYKHNQVNLINKHCYRPLLYIEYLFKVNSQQLLILSKFSSCFRLCILLARQNIPKNGEGDWQDDKVYNISIEIHCFECHYPNFFFNQTKGKKSKRHRNIDCNSPKEPSKGPCPPLLEKFFGSFCFLD